jgi:hypothetical protein
MPGTSLTTSSTSTADENLLSLIDRHVALLLQWNQFSAGGDDPRLDQIANDADAIELAIAATPVCTAQGLEAKKRFISSNGIAGDDYGNPPTFDVVDLIDAILMQDEARVAAAA